MGNSLLRMLAKNEQKEDQSAKQDSFTECDAMFDAALEGFRYKKDNEWKTAQV